MQKLLAKLSSIRNGDKIGHFLLGIAVFVAYTGLFKLAMILARNFEEVAMYVMLAPYVVGYIFSAILVHGFIELKDLGSKLTGGPNVPSVFDFLAGMAGSIAAVVAVMFLL